MKAKKLLITALATGTLAAGLAVPAQAATLYEHANYTGGYVHSGVSDDIGWIGDKVSSVALGHNEKYTMFEDINRMGRHFKVSISHNYLRGLTGWGLHWGETWDDRISSIGGY